jgi:signal peptidase I
MMLLNRFLLFSIFCISGLLAVGQTAEQNARRDSVVQLYGIVMTADSLEGIEGVSVVVKGKGRGTITNYQGVFSIVVLKGDEIEFTHVGYETSNATIPRNLGGHEYEVIKLMVNDYNYLPATIIRARPTRPQFERDFVNVDVPADEYEIARQNMDENKRMALMRSLPSDGREAVNYTMRNAANKATYNGQIPPMNIMNPFAWQQFIKSWKRGDFKKK